MKPGKILQGSRHIVIHLVHYTPQQGGIEVLLPVIVNNMAEYDFRGYVIREPVSGEAGVYNYLKIPVAYGSNRKLKAIIRAFVYFHRNRSDIIHCFNTGPLFILIMRFAGVRKLVYSIHGTVHGKSGLKRLFIKTLWRIALRGDFQITSNSEYSRNVFLENIKPSVNVQVLYNPVDSTKFAPLKDTQVHSGLKIIYVGRLCPGKNLSRWIETAVFIHRSMPDTIFEIYGSGPLLKSLQDKVRGQNAGSFIQFMGFRADIENAYRNSDVMLFLSEYESFGNVAVESILCGIPVIVSDIPSMREIFRDFPEFIVSAEEAQDINILNKLQEIDRMAELVRKARQQFLNSFPTEVHTSALDRIYKSFSDERG